MSPVEKPLCIRHQSGNAALETPAGCSLWCSLQGLRKRFRTVQNLKIKQVLFKITAVPLTAETETEGRRGRDWSAQGLGGASKSKYNIYRN